MKKAISLLITIAFIMLLTTVVNAADLTNKITISEDIEGAVKYTKTYDGNVTNIKATVEVTEDNINTILNQKSKGLQSQFYFEVNPNFEADGCTKFKKYNVWFGITQPIKNFTDASEALKPLMAGDVVEEESAFWPQVISVQYYDGANWVKSTSVGDGVTTIGEDLVAQLGLSSVSELVYGENFRFSMYDGLTQVLGWEFLDSSGVSQNPREFEFVTINYELKFPISAKLGSATAPEQTLFSTIKQAVNSGSKEITINKDYTLSEDVEIPAGVTLNVANNATLTVEAGKKLTVNGNVAGNVKQQYIVTTATAKNGTITLDKNVYAEGETVTVTVSANEGFELKELLGVQNFTKVSDTKYTFTMPAANVTVSAEFAEKQVEEPEPTYYMVTIDPTIKNGKIETDKIRGEKETTIIITVTADAGVCIK